MERLRKIKDIDIKMLILISCLVGGAWFLFIYGIDVVNVTNDAWILGADSDITQHYLGWRYYRASDWHFMFGLLDGITYPYPLSIIYMDAIPLFAVFFKILSPVLPETFQYLGLYGLVSFMLQSCLAALVMNKLTNNKPLSVLFGYLTLTYPAIYQRMFDHTALAGHWIIFLGIYVWCTKKEAVDFKSESLRWGIVMSLAVFLHPYYIPMIAVMMCCSLLEDALDGKWRMALLSGLSAITAALFWMFCLGAFYGGAGITDSGLGDFSLNLNGYYNSQYLGKVFKSWPNYSVGQAEGLAYVGAGCLVAAVLAAGILIFTYKKTFSRRKKMVLLYMVVMTVLALSPVITWNENAILIIDYSEPVDKFLSIFRASGRFGWPVAYLIMTGAFAILAGIIKKQIVTCLTVALIGLQLIDIYHYMDFRADEVTQRNAASMLTSPVWDEIAKGYGKIVFIPYGGQYDEKMVNDYLGTDMVFSIMEYAADNGMLLNDGYVSRRDIDSINKTKQQHWEMLLAKAPEEGTVYIFYDIPYDAADGLHLYYIDDLLIGLAEPLDNVEEFNMSDGMRLLYTGLNFRDCDEKPEGRYIKQGGESFGPYITLEPGTYQVIVSGDGLTRLEYDSSYNRGTEHIDIKTDYVDNNKLVYTFYTGTRVQNLEIRFQNNTEDWVLIESARIYKMN